MRLFFAALISTAVLLVLPVTSPACIVGDPGQPSTIVISSHPTDCCYGSWAGTVSGTANNVDTSEVVVRLYAQTDDYYIQPYLGSVTEIKCDGTFSNGTHGGHHYVAILAKRTWDAPDRMPELPPLDDDVLAIDRRPERRISWAGQTWIVKSSRAGRIDPGPNYWSDGEQNVWVDGSDRLHMRITSEGDKWFCAEVYTDATVSYGQHQFHLASRVDDLDPNVVLGLFIYEGVNEEIDIEFSRWGNPADPNGQYVIQPWNVEGNRHRFSFIQLEDLTTHSIGWSPDTVRFASWYGHGSTVPSDPAQVIQEWTYEGPNIPEPSLERTRINLWLYGGAPPADEQEVEIVIASYQGVVRVRSISWGLLKTIYR